MNKILLIIFLTNFSIIFSGCEFLGDIFQAGVWIGVIVVIAIFAIIGVLVRMFKK